ncbi:hypothetical protein D3C81_1861240 [compost metagenome]
MRKTESAWIFCLVAGETDSIYITESVHKHIQLIANRPGVHPQLKEQLIDRKVKGIHHPVFALINDPEGFILVIQQLS